MPTSRRPEQGTAKQNKEKFLLKDHLFNNGKVIKLVREISTVYPSFDGASFTNKCVEGFVTRELKERIMWIRECLHEYLPPQYTDALEVICQALTPELDPNKTDDDFGDFIYAPYADFVAAYGCTNENFDVSMQALHEITRRFSAEFAIRAFIDLDHARTYKYLEKWSTDKSYHVRRLVSEGTRPNLPWGKKINAPYIYGLPFLYKLAHDDTRYVTRSVANHLNDISKKDPYQALSFLKDLDVPDITFIKKHALRTLVKDGNKQALALLGHHSTSITAKSCKLDKKKVANGREITLSGSIQTDEETTANLQINLYTEGKIPSTKRKMSYKIGIFKLASHSQTSFSKTITLRSGMTTKTFYAGLASIELLASGEIVYEESFEIV